MTRNVLLAATAVIALTGGAMAGPPMSVIVGPKVQGITRHTPGMVVLYNQNSGTNWYNLNSQNYTSGTYSSYNDQAADDFVVPTGQIWKVKEIDVTGCCLSGQPTSENVFFYKDKKGMPGALVRNGMFTGLSGTGAPYFAINLGTGVKLQAGHYWVSVVANCNYNGGCGEWAWGSNGNSYNLPALWEQPGDGAGTGCTTWELPTTCFGITFQGDLMFELQGKML
jgi:hypothetical protein